MDKQRPDSYSAQSGLRLDAYSSGYGTTQVLREVSLEVKAGETVALLGPNGAGKTTVVSSIVGATRHYGGSVLYRDQNVTGLSPDKYAHLGISIVPQTGGVFPDLTIGENLKLARAAARHQGADEIEEEILATFSVLKERRHRRAFTLSGGQRQMLAIARALCCAPSILLLDEPSLGLAPQAVEAMIDTVRWARERYGLSVLLAEQHLSAASALCSRFYLLKSGRVQREGIVDDNLGEILRVEYLM